MSNNIKKLLDIKRMSINELSKLIEKDYPTTHALVNREDLGTTQLDTLVKVSNVLDVDIETLYSEKESEIRVLQLFERNYAGALLVETLRDYKNQIEKMIEEKINRYARLSYEYRADVNMGGVNDELRLEIIVGDKKGEDDRYCFYFKTKSIELIFKTRLVDIIALTIDEYEKGGYKSVEDTYWHLDYEGYNHSGVKLEKIEIEEH